MKKKLITATLCLLVFVFQYCSKKDAGNAISGSVLNLPAIPYNYLVNYPAHVQAALTATDNTPADNPITNNGATLGRVLFYDKNLSKNNSVSCASCHKPQSGFDDGVALSRGFDGGLTSRNSMAILNLRFYKSGKMFWDERSATLEEQVLQPIQNHVEMNLTLAELETKLRQLDYYPQLFQNAFGSMVIDTVRIAKALAQFTRSIVTYQAKYDRVKQGLDNFTPAEVQGERLFLTAGAPGTCASCHTPPMFLTSDPAAPFALADPNDKGIGNQNRFKSGSLRNIAMRTGLFHNGSITSLQAMLTAGAPGTGTLPIPHHTVAPQDIAALTAFLQTLTDNTIATEPRFSNPFK